MQLLSVAPPTPALRIHFCRKQPISRELHKMCPI